MSTPSAKKLITFALVALGILIGAAGMYVGEIDDAPGAVLIGMLLIIGSIVLGVRAARRKS